jgi:polyvinyl alcohol dehydrogenase (cytochrome)
MSSHLIRLALVLVLAGTVAARGAALAERSEWTQHGYDLSNTAYNSREAKIRASTVSRLTLKWRFPVNEGVPTTPAVVDGIVYFGTWEGIFYALEAATGREVWRFDARQHVGRESAWRERGIGIRSGISVSGGRVYFGDTGGYLTAADAKTGAVLWRKRLEDHPHTRVFSAAKIFEGRLYIGVSSLEESAIRIDPDYNGYTFRGSVVALDASSGREIWRFYTIARMPERIGTKEGGRPVYGPAGAAVWATPTLDPERRLVYVATGNAYSGPEEYLEHAEAVIALEMDTGRKRWSYQALPGASDIYTNERLAGDDEGPDYDFGQSPILFGGRHGNQFLAIGQKSGWMYLLNPENGRKVWESKVGSGGGLGGLEFGSATDGERLFVAIAACEGNVAALDARTGRTLWQTWNGVGGNHAPVVIAGPQNDLVVFVGDNRGVLRAYDGRTGRIIWQDRFEKGTSIQGGATVADGMVFVGGGFHSALGGARRGPGNELRAYGLATELPPGGLALGGHPKPAIDGHPKTGHHP